jgi:hypothetical protein
MTTTPVPLHPALAAADDRPRRGRAHGAGRGMTSHRLRAIRPRKFGTRLHAADIGSSTLLYAVYHGRAEVTALAPMGHYTLQLILGGAMNVATDVSRPRTEGQPRARRTDHRVARHHA